jgi:mono/diheme cytochrome c family protein
MLKLAWLLRWLFALAIIAPSASAATLTLRIGDAVRLLSQVDLLKAQDLVEVPVPQSPLTAKAIPLLTLLKGLPLDQVDTLEIHALDGFTSQIPMALVRKSETGGSTALLAIEDPAHPWPRFSNSTTSAGPFYVVWDHPERSGITSEQWPYQVAAITGVEAPVRRWPQIAVGQEFAPDAPARRGQEVFIAQCMPCHKMRGGGAAEVGPDLGQPMPAASYLTEKGLRALIRDPRSVRTWQEQRMIGFDRAALPDPDLDAVIAYLMTMRDSPVAPARP